MRVLILDKKVRVGYIPPRQSKALIANISKITFDAVPVQLDEAIDITDNPRDNSTPYGTLPAGTEVTVLAKYTYTGNWWYVETTLNGKLTRRGSRFFSGTQKVPPIYLFSSMAFSMAATSSSVKVSYFVNPPWEVPTCLESTLGRSA